MNKRTIGNYVIMFIVGFTILFSSTNNCFKALGNGLNVDTETTHLREKSMYNIQFLSSYKQKLSDDEFNCLVEKIYDFTAFINKSYPMHKQWFFEKLIPNIGNGTREVLFITDSEDNVVALSALKNEETEKKICTLCVDENFRGLGLGSMLIESSMEFLDTTKPLITFSENKLHTFQKFIDKYQWKLYEKVDIYENGNLELCYNGCLSK